MCYFFRMLLIFLIQGENMTEKSRFFRFRKRRREGIGDNYTHLDTLYNSQTRSIYTGYEANTWDSNMEHLSWPYLSKTNEQWGEKKKKKLQLQLSRFPVFYLPAQAQPVIFDRLTWDWCHFIQKNSGDFLPVLLFSIFAYFSYTRGKFWKAAT